MALRYGRMRSKDLLEVRRTASAEGLTMNRRQALTTAAGAVAFGSLPRVAGAADQLRIATSPLDAAAEAYYASDMGFYKDVGIDAAIQQISNGAAIATAVAGNAADIGFSNMISVAAAYKRNVPFTLIAPGSLYIDKDPTSVLMVPKNSPLKTAKDLNGKTLATVGLKTITEYAPRLWMDKNGGDSSSVKFVEMSMPQILEAFASHRVDGGIVAEPFIAQAKNVGRIFSDAYDAVAPRYLIGVWFAMAPWANAHVDLIRRFQQAMTRTAEWANGHTKQSGAILAKYGKFDEDVLKRMLRVVYAPRFNLAEMQPVIELTARYGGIPESFKVDEMIFRS
jgi:NitT/TauT family transport system substrate-binding protein